MIKLTSSQPKWLASLAVLAVATILIGGCAPANQPPIISSFTANEEGVAPTGICQIECIASDPDGNELLFEWSTDGGDISGEGSTIGWTAPEAPGDYTITVKVTDGRDGEVTTQLTVNVIAVNHPPIIEDLIVTAEHSYLKEIAEGYKILIGKSCEIECVASDPDGNELLFEWSTDGGDVSGEGAVVTWTAPPQGGKVTIFVTVSDSSDGIATKSIAFTVETCACKLR